MDIFKDLLIELAKKKELGVLSPENYKKIQLDLVKQKAKMRGKSQEEYIRWIESMRQKYIDEEESISYPPPAPSIEETPIKEVVENSVEVPEKEEEKEKEKMDPDYLKHPVIGVENLGGGDCFYSSIFRSLREANLLQKFKACQPLLDLEGDEYAFIQSLRNVVAGEVEKGRVAEDVYDLLLSVVKEKGTYKQILEAQPDWFRKLYSRGLPEKNVFFKKTAEKIRIMTNWAAELEVTITSELLGLCDIEFIAHNSNISEAATHTEDGKPILHLWNQGEAHWIRFSFDEVTPEYLASEEYKELKESLCDEECKAIEIRLESAQKAIEGSEKEIKTCEETIQKCESSIILNTERAEKNKEIVESLSQELEECRKKCAERLLKGGTRKRRMRKVSKNRTRSK
jgi:hypothetical protein